MATCVPPATSGAFCSSTLTPTVAGPTETIVSANDNNNIMNIGHTHRRHRKKPTEPRTAPRDERPLILAERFHTRLCKSFRKSGTCEYGAFCMFAHGKARLRTVDANVRDGLTTTEAIRAWQRARAAEAVAEELKLRPMETATVGSPAAEGGSMASPRTVRVSSELPTAIGQIGPGPIAAESPLLASVAVAPSTGIRDRSRVSCHDPHRLRVVSDDTDRGARPDRLTTYQHRPYDAVPVSRGPLTP